MQLRTARLCLDCDEVHDAQQCPLCASETFAYLTRWVPVPERPHNNASRPADVDAPETVGAYRAMLQPAAERPRGGVWRTVRRGAVGLALFGIAGWALRQGGRNHPTGRSQNQDAQGQPRS
jgi:hypothetical protein